MNSQIRRTFQLLDDAVECAHVTLSILRRDIRMLSVRLERETRARANVEKRVRQLERELVQLLLEKAESESQ